ncbi:hypothetical protein [Rothia dentocariosa]|uniref:hypothetical protein n=1 Tax=Rothia dentocariosa TaxID=2047 RepID=UPI00244D0CF7|nr:hypothetical protein [Rothia dentocariosa]
MKLFSKKFANTIPYPAQDVSPVRQATKIPEIVLHTHTTNLNVRRNGCRTGEVWSWDCEDCGDSSLGVYMHKHEAARSATEHAQNDLLSVGKTPVLTSGYRSHHIKLQKGHVGVTSGWCWVCEDCKNTVWPFFPPTETPRPTRYTATAAAIEHAHNHLIAINPVTIDRETGEPINDKE